MNTTGVNTRDNKSVGPVIGLIIILAIIIIGSIYLWLSRSNSPLSPQDNFDNANNPSDQAGTSVDTQVILNQSSSDDAVAIENDLNSFDESDIGSLDSSL